MRVTRWMAGLAVLIGLVAGVRLVAAAPSGDPVVLVHGWHGAGTADDLAGSSMARLGARLSADGWSVYWAKGIAVNPADTMFDGARHLGDILATVSAEHPGRPVRLIAHSYGGLVSRALLETERYRQLEAAGIHVSNLVTLGTPMGGVDVWLPLLFVLGDPLGEPSVWELTPAFMADFNRGHRPPAGTRYVVVAGDARAQVPPLWLLPASDGAISVASALALPARQLGLTEILTDDVHSSTDYTRALGWRSLLDDVGTFQRYLRPALSSSASVQATADESGAPGSAQLIDTGRPADPSFGRWIGSPSHGPVTSAMVAPGRTLRIPLPAEAAAAFLVAGGDGLAVTTVPDGTPPSADAATDPSQAASQPTRIDLSGLPGGAEGGGLVVAAGRAGATLSATNTSAQPVRLAWMGVRAPEDPELVLTVQVHGGNLEIRLTGRNGAVSEPHVTVLGSGQWRDVALAETTTEVANSRGGLSGRLPLPPGLHFVRARARVAGLDCETETVVRLGPVSVAAGD